MTNPTGLIDDLREKALEGIIAEKAHEDMGVYCQLVTGGSRPYKKRTPYMEGWNAYSSEYWKKVGVFQKWLDEIPAESKPDVEDFLIKDKIQLHLSGDTVGMSINCNDLFWWACADGEDFELSDLPEFKKAFDESSKNGERLWCCRKRGMRPLKPYYKYFDESEKALFDAAGPERTDA